MSDPARANEAASCAQRAQVSRSEPKASEDHQVAERRPSGSRRSGWVIWIATAIWFAAFAGGTVAFLRFEFTPGEATRAPLVWPVDSSIPLHPEGMTLVLFAHPHCVCTRASLDELQVILSHHSRPISAQVVFVQLSDFTDEEMRDESWEKAGRIPGIERRIDKEGVEARRFGALVSGYTLLYDAAGKLLFEGGVTGSRGQVGANAGRNSVIGFLRDAKVDTSRTPVFGCYLFDRAERVLHSSHDSHGA
jgi:hypothetical protein